MLGSALSLASQQGSNRVLLLENASRFNMNTTQKLIMFFFFFFKHLETSLLRTPSDRSVFVSEESTVKAVSSIFFFLPLPTSVTNHNLVSLYWFCVYRCWCHSPLKGSIYFPLKHFDSNPPLRCCLSAESIHLWHRAPDCVLISTIYLNFKVRIQTYDL